MGSWTEGLLWCPGSLDPFMILSHCMDSQLYPVWAVWRPSQRLGLFVMFSKPLKVICVYWGTLSIIWGTGFPRRGVFSLKILGYLLLVPQMQLPNVYVVAKIIRFVGWYNNFLLLDRHHNNESLIRILGGELACNEASITVSRCWVEYGPMTGGLGVFISVEISHWDYYCPC